MSGFVVRRGAPWSRWRVAAIKPQVWAWCETPLGEATLVRERGPRETPEDHANGGETWTVSLRGGAATLSVERLLPEPVHSLPRMGKGLEGTVDGEPFRLTGRPALRPARRTVTFEGPTIDVRMTRRRLRNRLLEHGNEIGFRAADERWHLPDPTDHAVLAVCLFEWARLEDALGNPLLSNP
ncbi:hypothetical protein [Streptomyces sp. NPDC047046]|uniref:hypothetical protein n=1 Tax=Streptomyces sp. NPDC047046 TaxID=3155378 RepID=UPI0033FE44A5